MNQKSDFKLVKGTFSPEDAKEVLFKLINSKIKFHQLSAFSISERNAITEIHTQDRIEELQEVRNQLELFISEAEKLHKSVKIDGTISIQLID